MIHWIKKKFVTVMELRDDKRSIAAGVAVGFFWGFTPLVGLKTLLSLLSAWLLRVNKLAAVVSVSLHDIFLPFYLSLYIPASYHLGNWILGYDEQPRFKHLIKQIFFPDIDVSDDWWRSPTAFFQGIHDISVGYFTHLSQNAHYVVPVLLGSVVLAIPFSVVTYFLTVWAIEKTAVRSLSRLEAKLHPPSACTPPLQDEERKRQQQQQQQ